MMKKLKTELDDLRDMDVRQARVESDRAANGFVQPPVQPAKRRAHFLVFLRAVPKGRLMSRYELEGGTGLFGKNLDVELAAAEEAGVIHPEATGWRKVDFFPY